MNTYIASRIRACVATLRTDPDPDIRALDELLALAAQVQRQEITLDELVDEAARRERALEPFRFRWSVAR